ncbi:MAG: indole-3-glycerol phosphate synthase TrpC [Candidatus Dadabacteria bacterium]
MATGTILDTIIENTRLEVAEAGKSLSLESLSRLAQSSRMPRDFASAISPSRGLRIIAEIKHASPSKGIFREDFDPVAIARGYESGGAAALSVLTDSKFFKGSLDYLEAVKKEVSIPLLRKDFMIDPYQVYEARVRGADAILLIVAALDQSLLVELQTLARSLGLGVLVEVHDEAELERALSAGSDIIGINNRDLRTFEVDLGVSERLSRMIPGGVTIVAESGISSGNDIKRLRSRGVHVFLIGETFMKAPVPGEELGKLIRESL